MSPDARSGSEKTIDFGRSWTGSGTESLGKLDRICSLDPQIRICTHICAPPRRPHLISGFTGVLAVAASSISSSGANYDTTRATVVRLRDRFLGRMERRTSEMSWTLDASDLEMRVKSKRHDEKWAAPAWSRLVDGPFLKNRNCEFQFFWVKLKGITS